MLKKTIAGRIVRINNDIMKKVNKYVQEISSKYKVKTIILFGSYAKGTYHVDSDIDIAIVTDDYNNIFEEQVKLKELRWEIDLRIEPHIIAIEDFEEIKTPLVKELLDTGIKVA